MALVVADRVKETSTTTGTGSFTLLGAVTGFQSFNSAIGNGNTTYYTIENMQAGEWETGLGTFTSPSTLARTTVYASSNAGSAVNFSAGTKSVFVDMSATKFPAGVLGVANGGTGAATISGVLKGNGTSAITAATAGTDYLAPPAGTAILKANSGGALANATAGTDYLAPPSGTSILKANSGGALANATAGTDYVAPGTATTFTATQTFNGSSSALSSVLANAAETTTISATAATGTINYDVTTQSVLYYTSNASANWTVNFRASSGTSLNTAMATGQSITVVFMVTQGATAYYNNAVQVDGNSVTPKYQGGSAWTAGNASSIDSYTYVITKTGNAAFTVFASQTQFK